MNEISFLEECYNKMKIYDDFKKLIRDMSFNEPMEITVRVGKATWKINDITHLEQIFNKFNQFYDHIKKEDR